MHPNYRKLTSRATVRMVLQYGWKLQPITIPVRLLTSGRTLTGMAANWVRAVRWNLSLRANIGNRDELELLLIENGAEDISEQDGELVVTTAFEDFIGMQRALEQSSITVSNSELRRIPSSSITLTDEQTEEVIKLIEKLEEDEDVQNVFHNMNED